MSIRISSGPFIEVSGLTACLAIFAAAVLALQAVIFRGTVGTRWVEPKDLDSSGGACYKPSATFCFDVKPESTRIDTATLPGVPNRLAATD